MTERDDRMQDIGFVVIISLLNCRHISKLRTDKTDTINAGMYGQESLIKAEVKTPMDTE